MEIPSIIVIAEREDAEWIQSWRDQLNLIEEKQLTTLCHGQLYQKRIKNVFDKKVRPRSFKEGDLVLRKILPNAKDSRGKYSPTYEGPYVVKLAFSKGTLILADPEGNDCSPSQRRRRRIQRINLRVSRMEELTPSNTRGIVSIPVEGVRPEAGPDLGTRSPLQIWKPYHRTTTRSTQVGSKVGPALVIESP
ncbi:hypothetical protein CR513_14567, partial [Mucuna pruriens]